LHFIVFFKYLQKADSHMKIINAIHGQSIGGVDQVFRDYNEVLIKQGHDLSLLISNNGNDKYRSEGVRKIFKLKNKAQILDFSKLLLILIFFRPDLIICHSNRLMRWSKVLKFFSKIKIIKTKTVAINHGITFQKSLFCDYIISINDEITKMVIDSGFSSDKAFTLKNAIKINQQFQEKTLKNPPIIGIYGRIEWRKGYDILIKACGLMKSRGYDFILKIGGFEIVGDDWSWSNIDKWAKEADIEDKCQKVGVVTDKKNFFSDVDIFCVPSREEPFGIVILESFLHSTLLISSTTVGGKLLVEDGKNGILFENENANDLAEKIITALNNPNSYKEITRNAFLRLEKEFSFDCLSDKMSKILQQISKNA